MSWLFSLALAAEYSGATCSAGVPSAQLNVMPTQHKFLRNGKMMEPCQLSRFGLTCAVLTEDHGADLLTWFQEVSLVKTYQVPVPVLESTVLGQVSGSKWQESSERYDLESSSWKTRHCLLNEDLPWSSVILPKWGTTRSGALFQHPTLVRPINVIESGLFPTPTASNTKANHMRGADKGVPRESRSYGGSGPLNPEWVEWLMGWPTGWTELKPLEMGRFREWQQQHSQF